MAVELQLGRAITACFGPPITWLTTDASDVPMISVLGPSARGTRGNPASSSHEEILSSH